MMQALIGGNFGKRAPFKINLDIALYTMINSIISHKKNPLPKNIDRGSYYKYSEIILRSRRNEHSHLEHPIDHTYSKPLGSSSVGRRSRILYLQVRRD